MFLGNYIRASICVYVPLTLYVYVYIYIYIYISHSYCLCPVIGSTGPLIVRISKQLTYSLSRASYFARLQHVQHVVWAGSSHLHSLVVADGGYGALADVEVRKPFDPHPHLLGKPGTAKKQ